MAWLIHELSLSIKATSMIGPSFGITRYFCCVDHPEGETTMKSLLMTERHQTAAGEAPPWSWPLAPRQVRTLPAATVARWLRVDEGCVWVTQQRVEAAAEDLWLQAGESLALPPGTAWIVEAWPQAQLSLLQAPPAFSRGAPWQRPWAWAAALLRRPVRPVHGLA
jgi:hypothetical protein